MSVKINAQALKRMEESEFSAVLGPVFASMMKQLVQTGTVNSFLQLGFNEPGDNFEAGDLMPTVHFSLQPFMPPAEGQEAGTGD